MRAKFARALRKWADLIDPRTPPCSPDILAVKLECDFSQFDGALSELRIKLMKIADAIGGASSN